MKIKLFALMILLMISAPAFADRDRGYYRPYNHHYNYNNHKNYFYQNTPKHTVYYNNYDRYPYYNKHNYNDYGYYDRNYYGRSTHRQHYNDAVGVILGVGILGYMLGAAH